MSNPNEMILPEIKVGKGTVRKYKIDDQGRSYEVEEKIEVPIFGTKPKVNLEEDNKK